jgi:Rrf2 family protein
MKFSAQEEFGLRCMIAMAREGESGFLTIPSIAKSEGLTQSHVAKLLSILRKARFIDSHRGQQGGYTLSRPAKEMLVSELLAALGGRLTHDRFCVRFTGQNEECVHTDDCTLLPLWVRIQESVDSALTGLTLADLTEPSAGVNVRLYDDPRMRMPAGV